MGNHKEFTDAIVGWAATLSLASTVLQAGYNNMVAPIVNKFTQVKVEQPHKGQAKAPAGCKAIKNKPHQFICK